MPPQAAARPADATGHARTQCMRSGGGAAAVATNVVTAGVVTAEPSTTNDGNNTDTNDNLADRNGSSNDRAGRGRRQRASSNEKNGEAAAEQEVGEQEAEAEGTSGDNDTDTTTELWSTLASHIGLSRADEQALPVHDRGRCKNLLVRDKKKRHFLLVAPETATIDFPHVRRQVRAKRSLSMVPNARLPLILAGAHSGCVSPFTLARRGSLPVALVLDEALLGATGCLWHVSNDPSKAVRADVVDVLRFCELCGIPHIATSFSCARDTTPGGNGGQQQQRQRRQRRDSPRQRGSHWSVRCRNFNGNPGSCLYGDTCRFSHDDDGPRQPARQ